MIIAYCIKCGNKFPKEAVFCPYCGTKVYRPEEDSDTPAQVPTEELLETPFVKVVEEPIVLNDDVKDFHERLTKVITANVEIVEVTPIQEVVIDSSSEPVKSSSDQLAGPASKMVNPESQPVNPSVEQPSKEDPQTVEEELENPSSGGCILAFFFPMIGFISALCNIGSNRKKAKRYALIATGGLLVGFISGVIQAL